MISLTTTREDKNTQISSKFLSLPLHLSILSLLCFPTLFPITSTMQRRHSVCLSDIPPEPYPCETSYEGPGEDHGKQATLSVFAARSVSTPDIPLPSSRTGTVAPESAVPASDYQQSKTASRKKKKSRKKKEKSISYGQGETTASTNGHINVSNNPSSPLVVHGASLPHRVSDSSDMLPRSPILYQTKANQPYPTRATQMTTKMDCSVSSSPSPCVVVSLVTTLQPEQTMCPPRRPQTTPCVCPAFPAIGLRIFVTSRLV